MNELEILNRLKKKYPDIRGTALKFRNPLEMLISTILSAQCTDERVNMVTEKLFKKYKTPEDYYTSKDLEQDIRPTGFYKNKAKNIRAACKLIDYKFGGEVPKTMEELIELPGVARKTANIVLGNSFGIVVGIAVDTHVRRLSFRLGLTKNKDPIKIEQDLMKIYPKKDWFDLSNLLIAHGRKICKASAPICSRCFLEDICPKNGVMKSK